jgi:hypothetical protein
VHPLAQALGVRDYFVGQRLGVLDGQVITKHERQLTDNDSNLVKNL